MAVSANRSRLESCREIVNVCEESVNDYLILGRFKWSSSNGSASTKLFSAVFPVLLSDWEKKATFTIEDWKRKVNSKGASRRSQWNRRAFYRSNVTCGALVSFWPLPLVNRLQWHQLMGLRNHRWISLLLIPADVFHAVTDEKDGGATSPSRWEKVTQVVLFSRKWPNLLLCWLGHRRKRRSW